ncbi:uncharacterized protein RCC_01510 [Ramularia collo-cygni]|uniref:Protein Zds1 C-terminal domain-containing protein n=1 Tax=Ramularia collo-cygni TaxID=112498 RepID=A0A2D3UUK4_9PEZI|nr:uncharacterized protein RCC_01510 [Ramularia collo-cygni]CZT15677.1 uncharacterized protein RCC_01510 [Ramularia collo-cygni]
MAAPPPARSSRQEELERRYAQHLSTRKHHAPQLSINDEDHHVTEVFGSWYEQNDSTMSAGGKGKNRPLSYVPGASEAVMASRQQRRHATLMDANAAHAASAAAAAPTSPQLRTPVSPARSNERLPSPVETTPTKALQRMGSRGAENVQGLPTTPPPLSRQSSTDTANQQFPLNDIDYESSPAAVAQELSNLQAIRRMSMNVDTADPDLPSFSSSFGGISSVAPSKSDDEDDPSQLFWVPARLHPELAPKEFKTFIEDRVDKIRRRSGSGGDDSLSPDTLERSGSGSSSLRRKKSMLSHQIDTRGNYEDGAERLERKRSSGMRVEGQATVSNLEDLEELVDDPAQLMRRMSIDQARRSLESGSSNEDLPILPPVGTLKRSTRTTYRRGSLKKGERVPFSKRAQHRKPEPDTHEPPMPASPIAKYDEPSMGGLTRVQTEPTPPPSETRENFSRPGLKRRDKSSQSSEDLKGDARRDAEPARDEQQHPSEHNHKQFQSRIASPGRTTAQLPGYNNTNPLPNIIETLPDGTKVPVQNLGGSLPERKSSHEVPRQFQRGGAHTRPAPGRSGSPSSTLDDLSSSPSPLPGSGNSRTDSLTLVPTFEEKKAEKKEGGRKSSWKWILGNDDSDKKSKDEPEPSSSKSKGGKAAKATADKTRLDLLQTSIDGSAPSRGRESIVLNREDVKLEEERHKTSKKGSESSKKEKDSSLLSAIFGGKKKSSDGESKEKRRKADRNLSPEPAPRILKPDIDYNWTRFSILEERAIYRMAHIKLANPRRALYSQVLLSNFMYSYLAKVQMMHPQIQIPAAQRAAQQRGQKTEESQQQQQQQPQQQQQQHPPEYNQYQRWQEVSIAV